MGARAESLGAPEWRRRRSGQQHGGERQKSAWYLVRLILRMVHPIPVRVHAAAPQAQHTAAAGVPDHWQHAPRTAGAVVYTTACVPTPFQRGHVERCGLVGPGHGHAALRSLLKRTQDRDVRARRSDMQQPECAASRSRGGLALIWMPLVWQPLGLSAAAGRRHLCRNPQPLVGLARPRGQGDGSPTATSTFRVKLFKKEKRVCHVPLRAGHRRRRRPSAPRMAAQIFTTRKKTAGN